MDLSVITVNYNTADLVGQLVASIEKNTKGLNYEVIVVDNNSLKESTDHLDKIAKGDRKIKLIKNNENKGFGFANNRGFESSKGKYVLFINSDTLINSNLLKDMTLWMERHNEVGVASCALKNTDGTYQETGGYFPTLFRVFCWMTFVDDIPYIDRLIKPFHPMHSQSFLSKNVEHFKTTKEVDWLTGAFLLTRRKILKKLGAFDKDFFMYTEDVELCFRIKKVGWKILYLPEWEITHIGGASSVKEFPILKEYEGIKLFYKKHNSNVEYQLLRLFLKIGAILRMLVFFIVKGAVPKTYAKAFRLA